jgi:hypothetical protein
LFELAEDSAAELDCYLRFYQRLGFRAEAAPARRRGCLS